MFLRPLPAGNRPNYKEVTTADETSDEDICSSSVRGRRSFQDSDNRNGSSNPRSAGIPILEPMVSVRGQQNMSTPRSRPVGMPILVHEVPTPGQQNQDMSTPGPSKNVKQEAFICLTRLEQFRSKETYTSHLNIHTGELPYSCDLCPGRFYSDRCLSEHHKSCKNRKKVLSDQEANMNLSRKASSSLKTTTSIKSSNTGPLRPRPGPKSKTRINSVMIAKPVQTQTQMNKTLPNIDIKESMSELMESHVGAAGPTGGNQCQRQHKQEKVLPCKHCDQSFSSASDLRVHTTEHYASSARAGVLAGPVANPTNAGQLNSNLNSPQIVIVHSFPAPNSDSDYPYSLSPSEMQNSELKENGGVKMRPITSYFSKIDRPATDTSTKSSFKVPTPKTKIQVQAKPSTSTSAIFQNPPMKVVDKLLAKIQQQQPQVHVEVKVPISSPQPSPLFVQKKRKQDNQEKKIKLSNTGPRLKPGPKSRTRINSAIIAKSVQTQTNNTLDNETDTDSQTFPSESCVVCKEKFWDQQGLMNHMIIHSSRPNENLSGSGKHKFKSIPGRFKCPYCQKKFHRRVFLITHIRFHTGEKPLKCDKCEMRFHSSILLYRHQQRDCQQHQQQQMLPLEININRSRRIKTEVKVTKSKPIAPSSGSSRFRPMNSVTRNNTSTPKSNSLTPIRRAGNISPDRRTKPVQMEFINQYSGQSPSSSRTSKFINQYRSAMAGKVVTKKIEPIKIPGFEELDKQCPFCRFKCPADSLLAHISTKHLPMEATQAQAKFKVKFKCILCSEMDQSAYFDTVAQVTAHQKSYHRVTLPIDDDDDE